MSHAGQVDRLSVTPPAALLPSNTTLHLSYSSFQCPAVTAWSQRLEDRYCPYMPSAASTISNLSRLPHRRFPNYLAFHPIESPYTKNVEYFVFFNFDYCFLWGVYFIRPFVLLVFTCFSFFSACKRKDVMEVVEQQSAPKKPRLVFTDLQRRTLQAIFKVCNDNM